MAPSKPTSPPPSTPSPPPPPPGASLRSPGADPAALCRGDASPDACSSYDAAAAAGVAARCPNSKAAAVWYDKSFLRYSAADFSDDVDWSLQKILYNGGNVSDPTWFEQLLAKRAAYQSNRMFATGEVPFTSFIKMFRLVQ